jgi:hypothetical protein
MERKQVTQQSWPQHCSALRPNHRHLRVSSRPGVIALLNGKIEDLQHDVGSHPILSEALTFDR